MSFQLQLVIPPDPVDLLRSSKEPHPPLFPQRRVRKYEGACFRIDVITNIQFYDTTFSFTIAWGNIGATADATSSSV